MNQSFKKLVTIFLSAVFAQPILAETAVSPYPVADTPLIVHSCTDFGITGTGENPAWQKASWVALNKIDKGGKEYKVILKYCIRPPVFMCCFTEMTKR